VVSLGTGFVVVENSQMDADCCFPSEFHGDGSCHGSLFI
jgi:hypothetical protein